MMKLFLSLLLTLTINVIWAQPIAIDSLSHVLLSTKNDTFRLILYQQLSEDYWFNNVDSSLYFAKQYLQLAQRLDFKLSEADALTKLSLPLFTIGDASASVQLLFKALAIVESTNSTRKVLPLRYLN